MSRYPSAKWKPITGTSTRAVQKDLLCLHTAVGYLTSTWAYFNRTDVGVYSHFVVGGVWGSDAGKDLDGVAWQLADTDYRAAANLNGNWRTISVETADNAARPIAPWTDAQCETLARLMADANRIDGIPLVLVPDSRQGRRGIAYHRQGCDPYRVAGGELWSSSPGKDCPTQARIDQIPGLIKRARAIVAGEPEDDMPLTDEDVDKVATAVVAKLGAGKGYATHTDIVTVLRGDTEPNSLAKLGATLGRIETAVDALAEPAPEPPPAST